MMLMGGDFWYQNAYQNFANMDNMIAYMNKHHSDKYIFKYSTPGEYVRDLNALNYTFPSKSADQFPLGDYYDSWWVGYFSSRPNGKSQVRLGSRAIHASSQLRVLDMLDQSKNESYVENQLKASNSMF